MAHWDFKHLWRRTASDKISRDKAFNPNLDRLFRGSFWGGGDKIYGSGIRLPVCSKLARNWKNNYDVTIFWHDVIVMLFWLGFVFLVNFSYLSKFNGNIITGSGVMTIFFYKRLTRNLEIANTCVWVFPIIWRLGWVGDTKLGSNACNKMLLNAAKCQGYSFYCYWVIKGNPTGGGKITPSPTLIRVNIANNPKYDRYQCGIKRLLVVLLHMH